MKSILTIGLIVVSAVFAAAAELPVGRFSAGDLSGWEEKSFHGKTSYTLERDGERTVLHARSRKNASGLVRKLDVDLRRYPVLRWSWKVDRTVAGEKARRKDGDDYAARVYVLFPGRFFWQLKAINYVWSAHEPAGSSYSNPFTSNAKMVVVETGDAKGGQWLSEERNVLDDYRRLFGEEPPKLGGVAVMTDSDNTAGEAEAWYGDIVLTTR